MDSQYSSIHKSEVRLNLYVASSKGLSGLGTPDATIPVYYCI
jgi:hypothetical protein